MLDVWDGDARGEKGVLSVAAPLMMMSPVTSTDEPQL